jgi:hypothetical protein
VACGIGLHNGSGLPLDPCIVELGGSGWHSLHRYRMRQDPFLIIHGTQLFGNRDRSFERSGPVGQVYE